MSNGRLCLALMESMLFNLSTSVVGMMICCAGLSGGGTYCGPGARGRRSLQLSHRITSMKNSETFWPPYSGIKQLASIRKVFSPILCTDFATFLMKAENLFWPFSSATVPRDHAIAN